MTNLQNKSTSTNKEIVARSKELPAISIVVPNYNGGATLGATLQSLVDQNYPKLEIIVVDGSSTDNSVEIIKQFDPHLTWWVSEKDKGQSNAINKGFAKCTGEIVNWLCSDDMLTPGALDLVGKYFSESPELDVLVGTCLNVFTSGKNVALSKIGIFKKFNALMGGCEFDFVEGEEHAFIQKTTLRQIDLMPTRNPIAQSSCFYRRSLLRSQPIDESYNYIMDFELWNYFVSQSANWQCVDDVLSKCLQNENTKTSSGGYKTTLELERLYKTYVKELIPLTFWHRRLRYPLECFINKHRNRFWLLLVGPAWLGATAILAPFYGLDRVWMMNWKRFVE
jgi:glycosyltransferase involved in cell wall biosynthesis